MNLLMTILISLFVQISDGSPEVVAPKVFIDCAFLDMDFVKNEMPYLNYVIDRKEADIYILITTQKTAGEGTEFTIFFIGQKDFVGMADTLKWTSLKSDSDDTIRRELVKKLKIGLVRYLAKTPLSDRLSVNLIERKIEIRPYDPWHNWVFSIGLNTYLNGQQKLHFNTINTTLSANKILKDWKVLNSLNYFYTYNIYELDTTVYTDESKSYSGSTKLAMGLSDHISVGGYASFYSQHTRMF